MATTFQKVLPHGPHQRRVNCTIKQKCPALCAIAYNFDAHQRMLAPVRGAHACHFSAHVRWRHVLPKPVRPNARAVKIQVLKRSIDKRPCNKQQQVHSVHLFVSQTASGFVCVDYVVSRACPEHRKVLPAFQNGSGAPHFACAVHILLLHAAS
jgi:hypothetical protein